MSEKEIEESLLNLHLNCSKKKKKNEFDDGYDSGASCDSTENETKIEEPILQPLTFIPNSDFKIFLSYNARGFSEFRYALEIL